MGDHGPDGLRDILQWDVWSWSVILPAWEAAMAGLPDPVSALGIGERQGGLSLWAALQGAHVTCTDLKPFPPETRALHERHGVEERITYAQADVTDLPFPDARFDVVFFKSVIGALGSREAQALALKEMHRVLRPGGVLLFAENLTGTWSHRQLRKRFVGWSGYWRYLEWPADRALFAPFTKVEARTAGLLAALGRSEAQRDLIARVDSVLQPCVPPSWRTIVHGVAYKG